MDDINIVVSVCLGMQVCMYDSSCTFFLEKKLRVAAGGNGYDTDTERAVRIRIRVIN